MLNFPKVSPSVDNAESVDSMGNVNSVDGVLSQDLCTHILSVYGSSVPENLWPTTVNYAFGRFLLPISSPQNTQKKQTRIGFKSTATATAQPIEDMICLCYGHSLRETEAPKESQS